MFILNGSVGLYARYPALFGLSWELKDRDIPRTLMEIMYFIIGIRAIINWVRFYYKQDESY